MSDLVNLCHFAKLGGHDDLFTPGKCRKRFEGRNFEKAWARTSPAVSSLTVIEVHRRERRADLECGYESGTRRRVRLLTHLDAICRISPFELENEPNCYC